MNRTTPVVTPERFASGMTYEQYCDYVGTPENLARESNEHATRRDFSSFLRDAYAGRRLTPEQTEALTWLAGRPGAPTKLLVIAEEWSSDCRRDLPSLARIAETMGLEMRIFRRDGRTFSESQSPSLTEAADSNADLMARFMKQVRGEQFQSIPVAAFLNDDYVCVYKYQEFPAIYEKDRILYGHFRTPRPGESAGEAAARSEREFGEFRASPFFSIIESAAVDEIAQALWRLVVLGAV